MTTVGFGCHRPRAVWLAGFACAVLLAGCLSPGDPPVLDAGPRDAIPAEGETGGVLSNYTWNAGPFDGDLAIGFALLPTVTAECRFLGAAMGVSQGLPPTMALFVEGGVERPWYSVSRGQVSLVFDGNARIQAAGSIEQRVPGAAFSWAEGIERKFTLEAGVQTNVTFAADGVQFMDEPTRPVWAVGELNATSAVFRASCSPAVGVVQAFAGDEVLVFNEASFPGGASAHAKVLYEDSGLVVGGRVGLDIQAPQGLLFLAVSGDLLANHVGAGVIQVSYPGGSELIVDRPSQLLAEYVVLGNPLGLEPKQFYQSTAGVYSVDATYASADRMGLLQGAMVGLSPVHALAPPSTP